MWEHKTEEPEQEERAIGTIAALIAKPGEPLMAYTVTLGYRPGYDDVWQDGAEIVVDREFPEAMLYLIRHELGADPLAEGPRAADSVRVWIPLDYDGETFPTVTDVDGSEWEALFHEAGYKWRDFNRSKMPFPEWVHFASATLKAAGVGA
jgi:hypothetical protein